MCELAQYLQGAVQNCSKCKRCRFQNEGNCFFSYECMYSDFLYFKEDKSENFICPNCRAQLHMYESSEEYRDDDTLIVTEHYECPECGTSMPKERVATYTLLKEVWTDEVSEL